jgi:hypothetical protein
MEYFTRGIAVTALLASKVMYQALGTSAIGNQKRVHSSRSHVSK